MYKASRKMTPRFILLAEEVYGCLDSKFNEFFGGTYARAAELWARDLGSVPIWNLR
jgi:hypothetical protein